MALRDTSRSTFLRDTLPFIHVTSEQAVHQSQVSTAGIPRSLSIWHWHLYIPAAPSKAAIGQLCKWKTADGGILTFCSPGRATWLGPILSRVQSCGSFSNKIAGAMAPRSLVAGCFPHCRHQGAVCGCGWPWLRAPERPGPHRLWQHRRHRHGHHRRVQPEPPVSLQARRFPGVCTTTQQHMTAQAHRCRSIQG